MKNSKKKIVMLVAVTILLVSMVMCLSTTNIFAVKENVTVVFTADSDSNLRLAEDNETLIYTYNNENDYMYNLRQGDHNITFTKHTDEVDGRFYDSYVATNISRNDDVCIVTPLAALGDIRIEYEGEGLGMWESEDKTYWASHFLDELTENSDVNHYEFRFASIVHEPQGGEGPVLDVDWANEIYTVDFGTASWEIKGKTVTASVEGKNITNGPVQLKGSEKIKLVGYDSRIMEPAIKPEGSNDDFFRRLNADEKENYAETWVINYDARDYPNDIPLIFGVQRRTGSDEQEDDWVERPEANTTAIVNLSSDTEYANSYENAMIEINGYPINTEIDFGDKMPARNEAKYFYNAEENNGKVKFTFSTLFIQQFKGTIQINDQVFDVTRDLLDYSNRTDWLNHYGHQTVALEIYVDKADVYNVKLNVAEAEGRYQWIGNFLWTDRDEDKNSDLYIGNSLLEVVRVVYEIDDQEVVVEGNDLFHDKYIEYDPYRETGSLVVPEGAKCTMRITPDYGYQVTSFGVNGNAIETGEAISEFTFPIHKGNFHLGAQVTPVEDKVDAKSEKVQSGSVEIGKGEFDSGSVVLTVKDANLSNDKIATFEDKAGEYTINNYLDINLDQVFYKGTEEDIWTESVHQLNNEASVALKLEEGLNGNDVIIIHNINDEDEYEIIEVENYDSENKTVVFKTKSFSSYAIASKSIEQGKEDNNEGDAVTAVEVKFNSNGGSEIESQFINERGKVVEPETPMKEGFVFDGWFEDSECKARFDFEREITEDITLYAGWIEEDALDESQEYELLSGDTKFIFKDGPDQQFEVKFFDILKLTKEEKAALGVTEEEFNKICDIIVKNTKKYGNLLNVFVIEIDSEDRAHTGKTVIKLKMTDELKKYNVFKLINLDDENNFAVGDVIDLKQEGENLVGNLNHLSLYALLADNIENGSNSSEVAKDTKIVEENSSNPKTGDIGIGLWVVGMVISFIGIVGIIKVLRKRK